MKRRRRARRIMSDSDEDVDEDDATFHPPEWFTTPVVFRPVVCPTRSGISFYATFKHKDDDVLVLAWRSSSWSEDEAFHTYRGKVSQSLIQLLGDPNGSDLRERVKKEFCDARQLGGYKEGNHDRDLPHDKEALYQILGMCRTCLVCRTAVYIMSVLP